MYVLRYAYTEDGPQYVEHICPDGVPLTTDTWHVARRFPSTDSAQDAQRVIENATGRKCALVNIIRFTTKACG